MYLFVLIIFLYSFIMRIILFIIIFILSFPITTFSWEKVPVPDYVNKKVKSPWNFFEDFEKQKEGKLKLKKLTINNKGAGLKPFKIKKDFDGNKYLEVTVKHGWNNDPYKKKGKETERAEFQTKQKRTLNKEIWIGFKTRLPKNFTHIDDRVLFFQFKNQHEPMKRSPLLGIRFYENGNVLDIAGDTGGIAKKSWNQEESDKHRIMIRYKKNDTNWLAFQEKTRGKKPYNNFKLTQNKSFKITKLGEWTTYKIGIYNTKQETGFVKVFKDNKLIFDYKGITYDWKGKYTGSYVRIGIYRDSGKRIGIEYPDQSIHFDDFTVVSDKKTLDKYLN